MTATLLVQTASVDFLPLLFGHPGPFPVRTVLSQEPLLGGGATERTGGEAPAVLHEDLPMDPLHQVVNEDGSPQVHFRVINEPELLQGHVKDVGSLFKNGDGLKKKKKKSEMGDSLGNDACENAVTHLEAGPTAVDGPSPAVS